MTLITVRYLWCDTPDCDETTEVAPYAQEVRELAKASGWVRRQGMDLCPKHAALYGSSSPEGDNQ